MDNIKINEKKTSKKVNTPKKYWKRIIKRQKKLNKEKKSEIMNI